jgi:hypothetical protein
MPGVSRTNHRRTMAVSTFDITRLDRPNNGNGDPRKRMQRQSWDFVIDGASLCTIWRDRDVTGALAVGESVGLVEAVAKLTGAAEPDYPPDRVAIFVCPDCGDLGCGAITVAVRHDGDTVTWSDFRWEVNWFADDPDEATVRYELGPFVFSTPDYLGVLKRALAEQPHAG